MELIADFDLATEDGLGNRIIPAPQRLSYLLFLQPVGCYGTEDMSRKLNLFHSYLPGGYFGRTLLSDCLQRQLPLLDVCRFSLFETVLLEEPPNLFFSLLSQGLAVDGAGRAMEPTTTNAGTAGAFGIVAARGTTPYFAHP